MFKKEEGLGAETIIANGVKVEGDFASPGNVRIEGIVKGQVKVEGNLVVTESASIEADITAANAIIAGEIHGNVSVGEKLELTDTAKLYGDIFGRVLSVAPGAVLNGRCQVMPEGVRETVPAPHAKQAKAVEV